MKVYKQHIQKVTHNQAQAETGSDQQQTGILENQEKARQQW